MALNIARWLDIRLVQGGADAFVQGSAATDIVPEDGLILQIESIDVLIVSTLASVAADLVLEWSVTRDTKTAVANLDDVDTILADKLSHSLTTSGAAWVSQLYRYTQLKGLYLVEPTVYAQLDTTGAGGAYTFDVRIFYTEVRASEIDILRVTTNS
jgi:hypothetical protein